MLRCETPFSAGGARATALAIVLAAAGLGCVGGAWRAARNEDTAAAYHRFLREHPRSSLAREARERIALVKVRARPSGEAYAEFVAEYPESLLLPELREVVDDALYVRARDAGTPQAYLSFLEEFSAGAHAASARGNIEYLEQRGFGARAAELADFATRHPQSDYAAEAARTAMAVSARSRGALSSVGLVIEIDAATPGGERLRRVFAEHAARRYEARGLELIPLTGEKDPRASSLPVRLVIRHREEHITADLTPGQVMASSGPVATTTLTLARAGEAQPIWSHEIQFRGTESATRQGESMVFGTVTDRYWANFFIPWAAWSSQIAVREGFRLEGRVVSVAATGSRVFVLFDDGGFDVYEIADPNQPLRLWKYRRQRDLSHWSDLRLMPGRVVLFGEDGIEVVQLGAEGPQKLRFLDRGAVGSIVGVEPLGNALVLASQRGLLLLPEGAERPEMLLRRPIRGIARLGGDRIVFTDGSSMFVSTLALLRSNRTEGELKMGRRFAPARLTVRGGQAIVHGIGSVAQVDLRNPSRPVLRSRISNAQVGVISDAALLGGRLFLLGQRGLQVADASGEYVIDAADVMALDRLTGVGRHLVMIGKDVLQLVDATPFLKIPATPAAAR